MKLFWYFIYFISFYS